MANPPEPVQPYLGQAREKRGETRRVRRRNTAGRPRRHQDRPDHAVELKGCHVYTSRFARKRAYGTLNFNRKRTKALIAHGEYVATGTLRSELGPSSPVYRLPYRRMTRLRPLFRALPRCSLFFTFQARQRERTVGKSVQLPTASSPIARPSSRCSMASLSGVSLGTLSGRFAER